MIVLTVGTIPVLIVADRVASEANVGEPGFRGEVLTLSICREGGMEDIDMITWHHRARFPAAMPALPGA
jgi:hypothetical protein